MSRIGRKPIALPQGVSVSIEGNRVTVEGKKGKLQWDLLPDINVAVEDGQLVVTRTGDDKVHRARHGLTRALLNNMVIGVSQGFEKQLEIQGIGYRAQMQGKKLVLSLGYSHPVEYEPPSGIEIATDGPAKIFVRGIDRQLVGQVAAIIRGFRPPENYKGKGIRYVGEYVIRKAGKTGTK